MKNYAGLGLRVLRCLQLLCQRFKFFLGILRSVDWQIVTNVSGDRNAFLSRLLRRTYWYIFADVSEYINS